MSASDFADPHSQAMLDTIALAEAIGEQMAIGYWRETGEVTAAYATRRRMLVRELRRMYASLSLSSYRVVDDRPHLAALAKCGYDGVPSRNHQGAATNLARLSWLLVRPSDWTRSDSASVIHNHYGSETGLFFQHAAARSRFVRARQ